MPWLNVVAHAGSLFKWARGSFFNTRSVPGQKPSHRGHCTRRFVQASRLCAGCGWPLACYAAQVSSSTRAYGLARFATKLAAIAVGGTITFLSLMAVVGRFTDNGWARFLVAIVVGIGLPALLADRLLPENPTEGKGMLTSVFAIGLLGFALLFVGVGISLTRGMLTAEAQRLSASGYDTLANTTHWLAGGTAEPTTEAEVVPAGGKAAVAAPADSEAAAADADADAGPKADAGPPKEEVDPTISDRNLPPDEIFKRWAPSVVTIQVEGSHGAFGGAGTGFVIASDGTVATNHHVIANAKSVRVKLMDGTWAAKVELLIQDEALDLALLRITPSDDLNPVVRGDSKSVRVGERAVSIGNPLGLEHTLTDGLVSSRRVYGGKKYIQMSTPISPGNSGGPVFNMRGAVIGVTTASLSSGFSRAQNLNLAVPIDELKALIKDDYPDKKTVGGGGGSKQGTW